MVNFSITGLYNPLVLAFKEHRGKVDDPGKADISPGGVGGGGCDNKTKRIKGCVVTGVYSIAPRGNSIVVRIQKLLKRGSFFPQGPDI